MDAANPNQSQSQSQSQSQATTIEQARPNGHTDRADGAGVVTRLVDEVINGGNTRLLPAIVAPEHVTHDPTGDLYGPEGLRIDIAGYRSAFPDLRMTTEDYVADGDRVARRFTLRGTHQGAFMGVAPTGRRVSLDGLAIHRVAEGRLVETWLSYDLLGLMRQLGAVTTSPGELAGPVAD